MFITQMITTKVSARLMMRRNKMSNSIINKKDVNTNYIAENYYIFTIDGDKVSTKKEFFDAVEILFSFPTSCKNKVSRFDDWMMDLSWLDSDRGICIVINNFEHFLRDDPEFKDLVMDDFRQDILPFWEETVLTTMKDGKTRKMDVVID